MGVQEDRAQALGDLVNGHPEMVAMALPELEAILRDPDDHYALAEAVTALGQAWDPGATRLLVSLVDAADSEDQVRLALAQALPGGAAIEPIRSAAIAILTQLAGDAAEEVCDWACFGLGQLDADGDEVRQALAAHLNDGHADTRCEALLALAKTGDPRALAATIDQLGVADPNDIYLLELAAASELADSTLLARLRLLEIAWADEDDEHTKALAFAVQRCQPEQRGRAAKQEQEFLAAIHQRLRDVGSYRSITLTDHYPRTTLTLNHPDGRTDHEFGRFRIWEDLAPAEGALGVESWVYTVLRHDDR